MEKCCLPALDRKQVLQRMKEMCSSSNNRKRRNEKNIPTFFSVFLFFSHVECSTKIYPIHCKYTNIILVYILPSGKSVVIFISQTNLFRKKILFPLIYLIESKRNWYERRKKGLKRMLLIFIARKFNTFLRFCSVLKLLWVG